MTFTNCNTIALVIYEYILTLITEIQLFWGKEVTGASIIFFVNRYVMLVSVLFFLCGYSPITGTASVSVGMFNISNNLSQNPQAYASQMLNIVHFSDLERYHQVCPIHIHVGDPCFSGLRSLGW